MRYERTLKNTQQGTSAVVRVDGGSAVRRNGALVYPLSGHQAGRLRRKLDPAGMGALQPSGVVGEFPEEQECPETPGYVTRVVSRRSGLFLEVRARKEGGAS